MGWITTEEGNHVFIGADGKGYGGSIGYQHAQGSAAAQQPAKETPQAAVKRKFGDTLQIDDATGHYQSLHIDHLAKVPDHIAAALAAKGVKVDVHDGPLTKSVPGMKGVVPRGWGRSGRTWDSVPGGYVTNTKTVVAGDSGSHGSESLLLHEYGHAVGDVMGHDDSSMLVSQHAALYDRLPTYLKQGGPGAVAGRQELFAEGFAHYLMHGAAATAKAYSPEFSSYMTDVVFPKKKG